MKQLWKTTQIRYLRFSWILMIFLSDKFSCNFYFFSISWKPKFCLMSAFFSYPILDVGFVYFFFDHRCQGLREWPFVSLANSFIFSFLFTQNKTTQPFLDRTNQTIAQHEVKRKQRKVKKKLYIKCNINTLSCRLERKKKRESEYKKKKKKKHQRAR